MHLGNLSSQRILMFILMGIMLISMVSALDWDNIKDYDSATKTYTITNALGMGETIAKIKLDTPIHNPVGIGYQKVFEMSFETFDDYQDAMQDIKFYNIRQGMKPVEIELDYKYLKITPVVTESCSIDNSTAKKTCVNITSNKYEHLDYNGKDMIKGNITISGWTTTKQWERIEWVPTYFGEELTAWADWDATLTAGLQAYYSLNETTGNYSNSAPGYETSGYQLYNVSEGARGSTGAFLTSGYSTTFDGSGNAYNRNNSYLNYSVIVTYPITICAWFNSSNVDSADHVITSKSFANGAVLYEIEQNGNQIRVRSTRKAGTLELYSGAGSIQAGKWFQSCFISNATGLYNYINGTQKANVGNTNDFNESLNGGSSTFSIGAGQYVATKWGDFTGQIDEVMIWNRSLTDTELTNLFNSYNNVTKAGGLSYWDTGGYELAILNSPADATTLYDKDVVFNCTGAVGGTIANISLIINATYNTTNSSVVNNTPVINTVPLADGYYNWTCQTCDEIQCSANATERTFIINTKPTIYVHSPPANMSNYTTDTIFINASSNLSVDKWIANYNGTNTTMSAINTSLTIEDGTHQLLLYGNNSDSGVWGLNDTYYFNVDATHPAITINTPNETFNYHLINTNLTLNYTISDTHIDSCWFDYGGTNHTINCSLNADNITINNYTAKSVRVWANDTYGNYNSSSASWNYRLLELNKSYTASVTEGTNNWFNISFVTNGTTITIGNLTYNNTYYSGDIGNNGNNYTISKLVSSPTTSEDVNVSWLWNITMADGWYYNYSSLNQTIIEMGIDNCSLNNYTLYNFTMVDEETQVELNESEIYVNATINVQLYNYGTNIIMGNYSTSFNGVNPYAICLAGNLTGNYNVYLQTQYDAADYSPEFYNIQNATVDHTDFNTSITLYDINESVDQEFKLIVKDSSFLPLNDALVYVDRKYIAENAFKTVELPMTDNNGETVAHLVPNTVIYNFRIVKYGVTIATFNNVIAVCQTPAIDTCTIDFNAFASGVTVPDFESDVDFNFTLGYNGTSRAISTIFNIPSGGVSTVLLNVTKTDALGTSVCTDTLTSASGTLSCTVPTSIGNSTVIAKLYKDSSYIAQGTVKLDQKPSDIYGGIQIVLAFFLMITLIGAGMSDNPVFTIIFFMVGVICLTAMNLVANNGFIGATATILWIVMAIIIVVIKAARRN